MKKILVGLAVLLMAGPAMAGSERAFANALEEFGRQQQQAEARARYDMEMRRLQEEREAQVRQWQEQNERLHQRLREQPNELPMMDHIWGQEKK